MACRITRNNNNQILKVEDSNGNESLLFNSIVSHPLIKDSETALNVYKNSMLPKIGEDAVWIHRVNDMYTSSYKEALRQANGKDIEIGFSNNKGQFFTIIKAPSDTNKNTYEGFLNYMIKSNILSEEKDKVGAEHRFVAHGTDEISTQINTEILRREARLFLGTEGVKEDAGSFTFEKTNDSVKVESRSGEFQRVKYDDLDRMDYKELSSKFINPEEILLERELNKAMAPYREVKFEGTITRSEKELQQSLLGLLNKLGVRVVPLTEYLSKYEIRNKVAPSATALADIANQVISYTEGTLSLSELTEETSHFIVEAMPLEQTENVLRNIHKTEEWAEFSDLYRELYRGEYSEEELDEVVRREVLGKVVKNSINEESFTKEKTEIQQNIFAKAREIVNSFFNSVRNFFKPRHRQELDVYLSDINKIIASQDVSGLDTSNFKYNKYRMYNANPTNGPETKIANKAKIIIAGLEQQTKALSKDVATSKVNRQKLKKAEEDLMNAHTLDAVSSIVKIAKNNIEYLNNAIKDSEDNNKRYIFSAEENTVYHSLKREVGGAIGELRVLTEEKSLKEMGILSEGDSYKDWSVLNKELKAVRESITNLEDEVSNRKTQNIERIVDTMVAQYDFSDEVRQDLIEWAKRAESETNFLHATFGSLAHSKDGMLRTVGYLLRSMYTDADTEFITTIQAMQKSIRDLGYDEKFFKDVMLQKGNYILSPWDFDALNKKLDEVYAQTYKEVSGTTDSIEEIIKKKENDTLQNLTREQEIERLEREKELTSVFRERPMKEEYYKQYEDRMKKANISIITKKYLSDYLSGISILKRQVEDDDGIVDWSTLSNAQRQQWKQLTESRKEAKSYYNTAGDLKSGLEYVYDKKGIIKLDENNRPIIVLSKTKPISNEARIAFDINNLDNLIREENKKTESKYKGIPKKFIESLRAIEQKSGREAALDFLESNAYISMSSEFWENLDDKVTITDRLKEEGSDVAINLYNSIILEKDALKNLLKKNARKNQPSEVDGTSMEVFSKQSVKQIQENLESLYRQAIELLPKREDNETEVDNVAIQSANESYINHLLNSNINTSEEEFDFAKNHMTDSNSAKVREAFVNIDGFLKGNRKLSSNLQDRYASLSHLRPSEAAEELKKSIIREKLLPYYTRYTALEYDDFYNELRSPFSNKSVADLVMSYKPDLLDISPNYSFFDSSENTLINPNYDPNFKGGYFQPKKGMFENQKFKDEFGGDFTSNKYKAYQAIMKWHEKNISDMGLTGGYNVYQKPQVRKGWLERLDTTIRDPKRLKYAFKDALRYTDDDMIKGDKSLGGSIKLIPKRYVYKLEDPEDVSEELFYSMTLFAQAAQLRRARINSYGDIMTVMDAIDGRQVASEKANESTQAHRMAFSAIENGLFDIQEEIIYETSLPFTDQKVDITKMAKKTLNYVKLRNLGFNIIIPLTSLITGSITRKMEALIGEFIDVRSQRLGARVFAKEVKKGSSELGVINHKAKINVLGQFFGAFNIEESFKSSNYSWLGRLIPKLGMGLHSISNYPIYGKNMFGILHDFRVVDRKITKWYDYKIEQKKKGIPLKDIKATWNTYEDKVLYKYIDVKDGIVEIDEKSLEKEVDNFDKLSMIDRVKGHISAVNERVDGQMNKYDRNLASRDYRLNFFNTHRQWLALAFQHRFKSRSTNLNTGKEEEGSYMSMLAVAKRYLDNFKKDGISNLITGLYKAYQEADQIERDNIRRVGIEQGILALTLLIGLLIRAAADDGEDDPFALKMADLLMARLGNELASTQFSIGKSGWEAIDAPFVGLNVLSDAGKLVDLFDSEEISKGNYRGYNKRERYLIKLLPGVKQVHDLNNLNQTANTYRYYNEYSTNNWYTPINYFMTKAVISEENKNK